MNIKMWAKVFGVVLTVVGILGFVPGITSGGHLLGIFEVDGLHNIIHLASGILALLAGFKTEALSRLFFKVFGVVYALVTVLGFVQGNTVLGLIGVNMADNLLHLVIAAFSLWLGFFSKSKSEGMGGMSMPM